MQASKKGGKVLEVKTLSAGSVSISCRVVANIAFDHCEQREGVGRGCRRGFALIKKVKSRHTNKGEARW